MEGMEMLLRSEIEIEPMGPDFIGMKCGVTERLAEVTGRLLQE
jgi:hypothetical protein